LGTAVHFAAGGVRPNRYAHKGFVHEDRA
jgi:hypothetical protein